MADNVAVTAGSGTSIATDDVGGIHYQRVKVDFGGDGLASPLVSAAAADATANPTVPLFGAINEAFNGTTWDRVRGNVDATLLASAARTVATNSSDQTNYNGRGLDVVIDITAWTAGSITVTIQGKDALSGKYYTILASAALAAVGTTVLRVHPGLTAAANTVANYALPRTWRVSVAVGTADSITYSIGASVVV